MNVPRPDGDSGRHPRPAMVLRSEENSSNVLVVAISTSLSRPLPADWLPLPFAPGGHETTGLDRECVLKCDWVVVVPESRIIRVMGAVSNSILERAKERVVAMLQRNSPTP